MKSSALVVFLFVLVLAVTTSPVAGAECCCESCLTTSVVPPQSYPYFESSIVCALGVQVTVEAGPVASSASFKVHTMSQENFMSYAQGLSYVEYPGGSIDSQTSCFMTEQPVGGAQIMCVCLENDSEETAQIPYKVGFSCIGDMPPTSTAATTQVPYQTRPLPPPGNNNSTPAPLSPMFSVSSSKGKKRMLCVHSCPLHHTSFTNFFFFFYNLAETKGKKQTKKHIIRQSECQSQGCLWT